MCARILILFVATCCYPASGIAQPFETLEPSRTVFRMEQEIVALDAIAEPPRLACAFRNDEKPAECRIVVHTRDGAGNYAERQTINVAGKVQGVRFLASGTGLLFTVENELPFPEFAPPSTPRRESIRVVYFADLEQGQIEVFARNVLYMAISTSRQRVAIACFDASSRGIHDTTELHLAWRQSDPSLKAPHWMKVSVPLDGAFVHLPGMWSADDNTYAFPALSQDLLGTLEMYDSPEAEKLRDEIEKLKAAQSADDLQGAMTAFGDLTRLQLGETALRMAHLPDVDRPELDARAIATVLRGELNASDVKSLAPWPRGIADVPKVVPLAFRDDGQQLLIFLRARVDGVPQSGIATLDVNSHALKWLFVEPRAEDPQAPNFSIGYADMQSSATGNMVAFQAYVGTRGNEKPIALLFDVDARKMHQLGQTAASVAKEDYSLRSRSVWVGDELWLALENRVDAYQVRQANAP